MAEGSWVCGAAWEKTTVDSLWYCISSMPHSAGMISFVSLNSNGLSLQFAGLFMVLYVILMFIAGLTE